ncbi:Serine/threonine-protein kinase [Thecaphora frezii]
MSRNVVRDDARIGDFILSSEIGKGSFAVVHKGYRQQTREPVAIKIVTRKKLTAKLLDNLEGEIAILKAINHPNIVELKECLKTDGHIYLVMAFCSAGDLSQYIRKRYDIHALSEQANNGEGSGGGSSSSGANKVALSRQEPSKYPHPEDGGLNETIVRSILTQLAGALEFMRGRDIVHRDIKPQNLLLQPPESAFVELGNPREIPQVKVADFGFARHLGNNVLAETLCGSPLYMAPEILRYEKYDAKADLWSVGAVLFEMSVGKPPYKASNHVELLRRIEKGKDKIKFPDERSADSLAREATRRQEAGEPPLPPAHPVSGDIKTLIRQLLRQRPVERMSFEDFFRSPVIRDYLAEVKANAAPAPAADTEAAASKTTEAHAASVERAAMAAAGEVGGEGPRGSPRRGAGAGLGQRDPSPQSAHGAGAAQAGLSKTSSAPIPRSFATKYVVGDGPAQASSSARLREARSEPERAASFPVPRESTMSRRPSVALVHRTSNGAEDVAVVQQQQHERPAVDGSALEEGRGEDSFLGKEYVVIEKRNVEVNALADELAASPQQAMAGAARRPSRLSRLSPGVTTTSNASSGAESSSSAARLSSTPPGGVWPSSAPFALPPGARPSSFPRRTSLSSSGSPSPRLTTQPMPVIEANSIARRDGSSGAATATGEASTSGSARPVYTASPSSSSPSSALARAISMASLRLFGVPSGMSLRGAAALVRSRSNRRASYLRSGEAALDGAESELLVQLEDLGQKSFVLSEFADSKLAAFFPMGPHQSTQEFDSYLMGGAGISPGRASGGIGIGISGTGAGMTNGRAGRRMSSASSISSAFDPTAAETAAAEALVLYVKSLSFLQRGINATKAFLDRRAKAGAPATASAELNEVVQWLRARFNEGYDKADFARSKCDEIPESAQHVDRLIFDKALEVARAAALDELENNQEGSGWDANHCLLAYETAKSMLMALLDPGEEGMGLSDGSIGTIEKFVKSINKRLIALQAKFGDGGGGVGVGGINGGGMGAVDPSGGRSGSLGGTAADLALH